MDRRAFLLERRHVPDISLSRQVDGVTRIAGSDVAMSNWLPGTLESTYQVEGAMAEVVRAIAIKEHVARKVGVHPSQIRIAGEEATCPSVPLSRFPFRVERDGANLTVIDAGPERLDLDPVIAFWRYRLGIADSPTEQLFLALVRRFLRRLTLADPGALDAVRGRPVMFLGNHQVAVESPVFGVVGAAINARPIVTIAKQEHRASWLGTLLEILGRCPGVCGHRALMFFDRDDKGSMLDLMAALRIALTEEGLSLMVHAEGTRSLQCRQPVAQVSGVLLDLAIAADLPIVPIRFAGGLPVEPAPSRLEAPLGFGKQEIHIGAPIAPEELAALPLAPRKQRVLAAMNGLGPDPMTETPTLPDAAFAAGVAQVMQELAIPERHATLLHMLQRDEHCHGQLRELVEAVLAGAMPGGEGPEADWLRTLGAWFKPPR